LSENRPAPEENPRDDQDSPWKEVLADYFPDFTKLLFPDVFKEIDWERGIEFLDHELQKVAEDSQIGRRFADKLAKVYSLEGHETWVLVHVEVQGYVEKDFAERMFVMNYRLFDRHHVDVVSLAVLTDENLSSVPSRYSRFRWGCNIDFCFPVQKLTHWRSRWEMLEASENRFALVIMAHLRAQESRDGLQRKAWKMQLIRLMYERGFSRQDILALFRVVDWILRLPATLEREFLTELRSFESEKNMPYVTSVEQIGIEQGIEQGITVGEARALKLVFQQKFGILEEATLKQIESANADQLLRWLERALVADSISKVFEE
jgi:hypothetical protein